MTRWIALATMVFALTVVADVSAGGKKPVRQSTPTGQLKVVCPSSSDELKFVLVSLYRNGELVRSRELTCFNYVGTLGLGLGAGLGSITREDDSFTWKNLPCDAYEIHFEAKGYAKGVKKVRVCAEDGEDLVIHVELDKVTYHLGDGPEKKADTSYRTPSVPPIRQSSPEPGCGEAPSDREVMRALPKSSEEDMVNIAIVKNRIGNKIDPVRFFPFVGMAQLHQCRWECTVYYTSRIALIWSGFSTGVNPVRKEIVFIDKDHLHLQFDEKQKDEQMRLLREMTKWN